MSHSIAKAVVIKHRNLFFLAPVEGSVPFSHDHGFGLYYHDCRYLDGYELLVGDEHPEPLAARSWEGPRADFQLTTPEFEASNGSIVQRETIGLTWERLIDPDHSLLHERLNVQNFSYEAVSFPVTMRFRAGFQDVFEIRGLLHEKKGKRYRPRWKDNCLVFRYEGLDGIERSLAIHFDPLPERVNGDTVTFQVNLAPSENREFRICLAVSESHERPNTLLAQSSVYRDLPALAQGFHSECEEWLGHEAEFTSDSLLLNKVMRRSFLDLHMLKTSIGNDEFFAAGVPWFVTLFGRDSLVTALQTLAYGPDTAADTLRLLARYQGTRLDEWRDEQPGKILHELRVGELARMRKIPHTPYYGTIDATPLFIILMSRYAAWTGDLSLFKELRTHIGRALEWIDRYGDAAGSGYTSYRSNVKKGLANQGWKDSGDAIMMADGRLARSPIALVEVQGYVYMAKTSIADLYERVGDDGLAARLRKEAADLRRRFNQDFWMEDEGCFALALEEGNRPCDVISSNPGHALWTGIVEPEKAGRVVERLMQPDLFSGWGIRTLSSKERRYNPIGYHLGTVWPHDNSLIAAGFRRYGHDAEAGRIFIGLLEAAMEFEDYRLPELFTGYSRDEFAVPVRYPVACHPQAWAAGAIPFIVETFLGLEPDGFTNRLRIVNPDLPEYVRNAEYRHLRVGNGSVDLAFHRVNGKTEVEVTNVTGSLKVDVEQDAHRESPVF